MEVFIESSDQSILHQDIVTSQEHGELEHAEQAGSTPNGSVSVSSELCVTEDPVFCNSGESELDNSAGAIVSRAVFGAPDPSSTVQQFLRLHCVHQMVPLTLSALQMTFMVQNMLLNTVYLHRCQCLLCSQQMRSKIFMRISKLGKTKRIL